MAELLQKQIMVRIDDLLLPGKRMIRYMPKKMKLCKFFDDPPSLTHEAVDELLQDSVEAEAPANECHINF